MTVDLAWQPSLFDSAGVLELDPGFHGPRRHEPRDGVLLDGTPWGRRTVRMYDRVVAELRLTHRRRLDHGPAPPRSCTPWPRC